MRRWIHYVMALIGSGAFAQPNPPAKKGVPVVDLQAAIEKAKPAATAQNQFGLKLLELEAAAHPHGNVFISPLSLPPAPAKTGGGRTRKASRREAPRACGACLAERGRAARVCVGVIAV